MSNYGNEGVVPGFIVGLVVGVFVALAITNILEQSLKQQAIERGFAEYNQTTGEWQWKEGE